jgi:hypothetical protein
MDKVIGICHVCDKVESVRQCEQCGRPVCLECMVPQKELPPFMTDYTLCTICGEAEEWD